MKKIISRDVAHFYLNCFVNRRHFRISALDNPLMNIKKNACQTCHSSANLVYWRYHWTIFLWRRKVNSKGNVIADCRWVETASFLISESNNFTTERSLTLPVFDLFLFRSKSCLAFFAIRLINFFSCLYPGTLFQ